MTAALLCLSAALVVAPVHGSVMRWHTVMGTRRPRRLPSLPRSTVFIVFACTAALFVFGVHAAVAATVLAVTVRSRVRCGRRRRERAVQQRGLLDGLETMIGELRAGAHPSTACAVAAQECSGNAAAAFAVAAARARLGGTGSDSLRDGPGLIRAELDRVADAWRVAERHGLGLAELLAAARSDLLGRIRFRGRTESGLAGARATAAVLAGLPVLGVLLGQLMGAAPLRVLLGGGIGGVLLLVGTGLTCAGILWADAITGRVIA